MRRPGSTAVRALAACAASAALVTGCGVQDTGVVEAGGPATVSVYPDQQQRVLLFFLTSSGRLAPVSRMDPTDPGVTAGTGWGTGASAESGGIDGRKLLAVLFHGPSETEAAAGLHTELPPGSGVIDWSSTPDGIEVRLPLAVRSLKRSAVRQIVCTTAYAEDGDGLAEVVLVGRDGMLPPARC
ncbi:hypothetical protein [Streptomyces sp. NPDC058964]|uniref:hypothetical protein n=1 Tax=Streptomyces sp. NPDC058964 TaxID=3346681 RepID=UPI003699350C